MRHRLTQNFLTVLLIASWAALAAYGFAGLARHANGAGDPGEPPALWPDATGLALAPEAKTLVMFVHPRCACSRASVGELRRVATRLGDRVATRIVFTRPPGMTGPLADAALWSQAELVPGAVLVVDEDGAEARLFGAKTSGHVVLFDAGGRRRFSGGITGARGHEGDNDGKDRLLARAAADDGPPEGAPVFGCDIFGASAREGAAP